MRVELRPVELRPAELRPVEMDPVVADLTVTVPVVADPETLTKIQEIIRLFRPELIRAE